MREIPGATWQWVTASAALVICFCLGVHFGRYLERDPESPAYSTSPAEAAVQLIGMPLNDPWAEEQRQKIRAALKKEISLELLNTPFEDFWNYFRDESGVNCHIEHQAQLSLRGLSDREVTCKLSGVPLQTLLETVLHERQLEWTIRGGVLLVITREMAAEMLETRVYPVRDLGQAPRFRGPDARPDPILEVIQRSIEPSSWDNTGGPGSIERFPNADSLIIAQTSRIHDEIAVLLAQVREARQKQARGKRE